MKNRKYIYWVAMLAIPFLAIVLLELGLRLGNVGSQNSDVFIEVPGQPEYLAFNPTYGRRYFPGFTPAVAYNPFVKNKTKDTYRVFVLGGSTVAGFPYQFYDGFPARLAARLESTLIGKRVEVVNLGMTAVNSYTLLDLSKTIAKHEPDAVLIYAGHNEYYGALGAGSNFNSLAKLRWAKRLVLRLKTLATYAVLENLITKPTNSDASTQDRTVMAQAVRESEIEVGSAVFVRGENDFRKNLDDIIRSLTTRHISVFVGTLVSNVGDQRPLGSNQESAAAYDRALQEISSEKYAQLVGAKDADNIRFRAHSNLNDIIEDVCTRYGAQLVDIEQVFRSASSDGIPGDNLFTDHLHPTAEGYELMAQAFAEALVQQSRLTTLEPIVADSGPDRISAAVADLQVARLKSGYPFRKDVTPEEETQGFADVINAYYSRETFPDSAAIEIVQGKIFMDQALRLHASRPYLRVDTLRRLQNYRALLHWTPFNERFVAGVLSDAGTAETELELAGELAAQAHRFDPGDIRKVNLLAVIRLKQQQYDHARALLDVAESLDPNDQTMLTNYARLLVVIGDTLRARSYFDRLVRQ